MKTACVQTVCKMWVRCCCWIHVAFVLVLLLQVTECLSNQTLPKPANVRIFGGSAAKQGQFPFQVMLIEDGNRLICGGSIINKWTVLTAAHCLDLDNPSPQKYIVVAGRTLMKEHSEPQQLRHVEKVILHANYDPKTVIHDVAILHVSVPFIFINGVKPVRLSDGRTDRKAFKSRCVASGWGTINNRGTIPSRLLWVRVRLTTIRKCNKKLQRLNIGGVSRSNICTADRRRGTCLGDSGGPMGCYVKRVYRQVGVTSWGPADCNESVDVFTRVSFYRRWIQQNTKILPNNDS